MTATMTLHDAQVAARKGLHHALTAIEKAIASNCQICKDVWKWLSTYWQNARALALLKEHAPKYVPAAAVAR